MPSPKAHSPSHVSKMVLVYGQLRPTGLDKIKNFQLALHSRPLVCRLTIMAGAARAISEAGSDSVNHYTPRRTGPQEARSAAFHVVCPSLGVEIVSARHGQHSETAGSSWTTSCVRGDHRRCCSIVLKRSSSVGQSA